MTPDTPTAPPAPEPGDDLPQALSYALGRIAALELDVAKARALADYWCDKHTAATAELARLREGATDEGVVKLAAAAICGASCDAHECLNNNSCWDYSSYEREATAALSAITPLIRARVREECAKVCEELACDICAATLREGRADG